MNMKNIWEVSFAADCEMKIVKTDYAAKEYFDRKTTVFPFGRILVNRVHW